MSDPEITHPPMKPTPRWKLLISGAKSWCEAHPDWLLAFGLGFLAGAVLL